jgi:hypothetical protein
MCNDAMATWRAQRSATRTVGSLALLTAVLLTSVLAGCDLFANEDLIDEDIRAFVNAAALPEAHPPEKVVEDQEAGVTLFSVDFGPGCDCPSGCFYSTAYGLQFRERIGWAKVRRAFCLDDSVDGNLPLFDIQPDDRALFRSDLRDRLREGATVDEANDVQAPAYEVFLNLLAKDADTPAQTLLDLARLLSSTYRPDLGFALLENPTVRSSERGLRVLTGLPGNGGYREVRDRARELLAQITESNAGGLPKKFSGSGTPAISAVSGDRWSDLEVLTVRLGRSRYRSPEAPAACGGLRATVPVPVWRLTGRAARLR